MFQPGEPSEQTQNFEGTVPTALVDSAGYLLNEAAIVIREMDEAALAPLGINPRQLGILKTIVASEPQTQQAIGERNRIDRTTMVKLTDALEQRGLIVRVVQPKDRRRYALSLTPEGGAVLAKGRALVEGTQDQFLSPLTRAEWTQLRHLLTKLLATSDRGTASSQRSSSQA